MERNDEHDRSKIDCARIDIAMPLSENIVGSAASGEEPEDGTLSAIEFKVSGNQITGLPIPCSIRGFSDHGQWPPGETDGYPNTMTVTDGVAEFPPGRYDIYITADGFSDLALELTV